MPKTQVYLNLTPGMILPKYIETIPINNYLLFIAYNELIHKLEFIDLLKKVKDYFHHNRKTQDAYK